MYRYWVDGFEIFDFRADIKLANSIFEFYESAERMVNSESPLLREGFLNDSGVAKQLLDVFANGNFNPATDIFENNNIRKTIESLYPKFRFYSIAQSKITFKKPHEDSTWFPHQDNGYKPERERRIGVTVVIPLEVLGACNGGLTLCRGSHAGGTIPHEFIIENASTGDGQASLPWGVCEKFDRVLPELEVGEVLFFHADTIHFSGVNNSEQSDRLCLIYEVEPSNSLLLDDKGRCGKFWGESPSLWELIKISIKSAVNPNRLYWFAVEVGIPRNLIRKLARKLK